ncbi:MAG: hypothetical protein JOY82_04100 [Streptosporangiaceae bacterium]|nr:hypothetical protein [Streptosporangiaceae bacterium]MBV9853695.1 hypothetical protein [Streptosporangiaceae bacterium]
MEDLFDFQKLRIQQPGKWLPSRASYEIFNAQRQLLAIATETEGHTRRKLLSKHMPDTRVIEVTTAAREPVLSLVKQTSEWITDLHGPEGELIGRIRTGGTKRLYTLLDEQDQIVGKVEGDLALKHFSVKAARGGGELARIRKTFAGITKEMLTPNDHYMVEFAATVPPPARTLTAMMPIVLDLTLYGPT